MNVPRALDRIAPRGGHRLSGPAGGLSARARACRSTGLIALTSTGEEAGSADAASVSAAPILSTTATVPALAQTAGAAGAPAATTANGRAGLHVWTTERYQAGSAISMPRILGHRDVGYTTCPGNVGYSRLGAIRSIAQTQVNGGSASSTAPGSVALRGAILTAWTAAGGERSKVGLPVGYEIRQADGTVTQAFEKGRISVSPTDRATVR